MELSKLNTLDRFIKNIEFTNSCWIWSGHTQTEGYGQFKVNYRQVLVHRFSYGFFFKLIQGFVVHHICRNRRCVNPDHLVQISQKENKARDLQKFCKRGHLIQGKNLYIIKHKGYINKYCRLCFNVRVRNWKRRKRKNVLINPMLEVKTCQ